MSRCVRRYSCVGDPKQIMEQINFCMLNRGYAYKNYEGDMMYHKGNGFLVPPKCFKIYMINTDLIIEGWMKWTLLPYVAVGEMDFTRNTFFGLIPKSQMQGDLAELEKTIAPFLNNMSANPMGQY